MTKRFFRFTATVAYQRVSELIAALANGSLIPTQLKEIEACVDGDAEFKVRLSIVTSHGASTGDDDYSRLLSPGIPVEIGEANLQNVWIKGEGGEAVIYFEGQL